MRRKSLHHGTATSLTRAVKQPVARAGIVKPATCHPLRHRLATYLVEAGHDIRIVHALPGDCCVTTTQIHTHVPNKGAACVATRP